MRDFTPRRFDAEAGELWIDFFLHEGGPAATWAAQATVGQTLQIGGPKGSAIIAPEGIDAHVLIGDETALPAISRRLEELPAAARTLVVVEIEADSDRPLLAMRAAMDVVWASRDGRTGPPARYAVISWTGAASTKNGSKPPGTGSRVRPVPATEYQTKPESRLWVSRHVVRPRARPQFETRVREPAVIVQATEKKLRQERAGLYNAKETKAAEFRRSPGGASSTTRISGCVGRNGE